MNAVSEVACCIAEETAQLEQLNLGNRPVRSMPCDSEFHRQTD